MRIVFAGTPEFAAAPLRALLAAGMNVVGVLTQPDRPAGRGRASQPSPVRQVAQAHALPVACPESLKAEDALAACADWNPDWLLVIAYGQLLPARVLRWPRRGCINLHASLLPRWRGAAPIQRAIAAGDTQTGLCLMEMEAGLDTGPVLAHSTLAITETMTAGALHDALVQQSCAVLPEWLRALEQGRLQPVAQPSAGVTYAHKLHKAEAELDVAAPAVELARKIRAYDPWPVASVRHAGEAVRLFGAARALALPNSAAPGTLLACDAEGVTLATGAGALWVPELQWPGRNRLPAELALRGRSLQMGDRLG